MKRVIVTGATSFIGVHLVGSLIERGYYVYALIRPDSRNKSRLPIDKHLNIVELEMDEYSSIPSFIKEAEYFYHLAWDGVRSIKRDNVIIQQNNYRCSLTLINVARKMNCKRFIGIGSQAEYGELNGEITENYPCKPVTEYGKAKLKTYTELAQIAESNRIEFVWARLFSVYGEYDYQGSLIMSCIEKMRNNENVLLTACNQKWDYLHVKDAVSALIMLLEKPDVSGIYNIASGENRELKSYVEEIKEIIGAESVLEYGAISNQARKMINLKPNVEKLRNIGWNPSISFSEGIKMLCRNGNK